MERAPVKHFKLHRNGLDIQPVLSEISAHDAVWAEQTGRQNRVRVQAETHGIPLRGLRRSKIMGRRRRDVHETRYTSLSRRFPETTALLQQLAVEIGGQLGRAKLARLPPGGHVMPHVDRGTYYEARDRYHLVIASHSGSIMRAGDEEVWMRAGELWWFDNKAPHAASNDSAHHRIHLIFDLEPDVTWFNEPTDEQSAPDPKQLLDLARSETPSAAADAVAAAVRLYLAIRRNPLRWRDVLREHNLVERAEKKPLAVLTQLLWPDLDSQWQRRRASAIAWSLAQLDLRRIDVAQVSFALNAAGGVREVHRCWRSAKEETLYGAD